MNESEAKELESEEAEKEYLEIPGLNIHITKACNVRYSFSFLHHYGITAF